MPLGIFAVVSAIAVGGTLGARLGKHLPDKLKEAMPLAFALASMAMGMSGIVKMHALPVVILSLLLGTAIGTLCNIEKLLRHGGERVASLFAGNIMADGHGKERYLHIFSVAAILFCTGPTGIYGSMVSSITGDHSMLFSKCFLDLFTAGVFAASIGNAVTILAVPVFAVFMFFWFLAGAIAPLITPEMFADFSSVGGMLIFATGFRIAEIKMFPVADMLPAMLLAMPISYLWALLPL